MKNTILTLFSPENEFFNLTKDSKRITHIWLSSFILPVVFLAIAGLLTRYLFAPLFFGDPTLFSHSARRVFGLYVMFGTSIALIFLWVRFYEGRPIYSLGFTKNNFLTKYISGFGTGILLSTIVVGTMALFGSIEISTENSPLDFRGFSFVLIFLFGFMIQGASEEILTRGWMLQVIGSRYKPWIGVIISTLFFALVHMGNSGVNFFAIFNLLIVAILLVLYVMRDGSLWSACGWHSAWNWSLGNVYGLSVSGSSEMVSIINLDTIGTGIISGDDFGPEGSIVTTFVLLIMIIWESIKIIRSQRTKLL